MLTAEKRNTLLSLSTSLVMDAVFTLKLPERMIDRSIRPITPFSRMVGSAVTVFLESQSDPSLANLDIYRQAFLTGGGMSYPLMVVEVPQEHHNRGIFGEGCVIMGRQSGYVGALIEGSTRDSHDLGKRNFPVFSRGTAPGYIGHKVSAVHAGKPVCVGGLTIHPGQIIFGDNDGVIVIEEAHLDSVIQRACEIQQWEEKLHKLLANGWTPEQIQKEIGPLPS